MNGSRAAGKAKCKINTGKMTATYTYQFIYVYIAAISSSEYLLYIQILGDSDKSIPKSQKSWFPHAGTLCSSYKNFGDICQNPINYVGNIAHQTRTHNHFTVLPLLHHCHEQIKFYKYSLLSYVDLI